MVKIARVGIIALGVLLMVGMFVFANVLISPEQKAQIQLGAALYDTPLGQLLGGLSVQLAQAGQTAMILSQILALEIPFYFVGFFLVVVGTLLGRKGKVKTAHISEEKSEESEEEEKEEESEETEELEEG